MSDSPVVFLDIDGVLNHAQFGEDTYYDTFSAATVPLNDSNVENFKSLLKKADSAKVVWSTDWRLYNEKTWHQWQNPLKWLEGQKFMEGRVIGKTPRKMSSEHFHDIKWWLDAHPDVTKFVILEDSYFPEDWFGIEKHVVHIDSLNGLTAADVDSALKILETVEYKRG